ncbi:hypothetical protein CRM22_001988 [Opisthorchis felineus]|uniref:Uncharacterized protein n=1 Tax=Opisthorchis felineus TaxID=147828 RepID=A0A4S2M8A8_OPIFE|nr:hypothetical protein CRM22_001988 [Opisthorchis felineus]
MECGALPTATNNTRLCVNFDLLVRMLLKLPKHKQNDVMIILFRSGWTLDSNSHSANFTQKSWSSPCSSPNSLDGSLLIITFAMLLHTLRTLSCHYPSDVL